MDCHFASLGISIFVLVTFPLFRAVINCIMSVKLKLCGLQLELRLEPGFMQDAGVAYSF